MTLRIGTRGSDLALWQSRWVAARVTEITGEEPELVIVQSLGDADRQSGLATFGGTGAFTKALDLAQLRGDFEISVHSLKDLPTAETAGLVLAAVPERAPIEDCLVTRDDAQLADFAPGARVGTGSPRRAAQLKRLRPDLDVVGIRGNVPTRVEMARSGELAAVVLARAGLERLGLGDVISEVLDVERMLPAAAQGALGIVMREDCVAHEALAELDHAPTRVAVELERGIMAELGAGCHAPMGVLARFVAPDDVEVIARLFSADGARVVEDTARIAVDAARWGGADGVALRAAIRDAARAVASRMREAGAEALL